MGGRRVSDLDRNHLAAVLNRSIGFVFQNFNLLPHATTFEIVELPLVIAGISRRERKARVAEMCIWLVL